MGSQRPYSASKGCTELVVSAYRHSFFNTGDCGSKHQVLIASGRAGNVIGGGDWAADRIITGYRQGSFSASPLYLPLSPCCSPGNMCWNPGGYLALGWKLLEREKTEFAEAWNFGPESSNNVVSWLGSHENLAEIHFDFDRGANYHEAGFLMLDSSKAEKLLHWEPVWQFEDTVAHTITWYRIGMAKEKSHLRLTCLLTLAVQKASQLAGHANEPVSGQNILITGVEIYLGSYLIEHLAHAAPILSWQTSPSTKGHGSRLRTGMSAVTGCDFTDAAGSGMLQHSKSGHHLSFRRKTRQNRDFAAFPEIYQVNTAGTFHLLQAHWLTKNIRVFTSPQLVRVYGALARPPFHETDFPSPLSPYSLSNTWRNRFSPPWSEPLR